MNLQDLKNIIPQLENSKACEIINSPHTCLITIRPGNSTAGWLYKELKIRYDSATKANVNVANMSNVLQHLQEIDEDTEMQSYVLELEDTKLFLYCSNNQFFDYFILDRRGS